MLFNSPRYLVFLAATCALYWALPSRYRNHFLLAASYVFYMSWMVSYALLIFGLAITNYCWGLLISRATRHRKTLLVAAIVADLGVLALFKYTNFLVESAWALGQWLGLGAGEQPLLDLVLPLGISFFTFEFVHYVVDIYHGRAPIHSFTNFHLFASFFPTQIAGPIKRFEGFNAQLRPQPPFDWVLFQEGIELILVGLFKKMVLADWLASLVTIGFDRGAQLGTMDTWLCTYAFAWQIFFDFSGYTDIGRGSAQLLGYRVPPNFGIPYLAGSVADFWRRWHISLSTWLRDYLYIPLGGSRGGRARTVGNLVVTMALGGLWHGAAWHFVAWGLFQASALLVHRAARRWTLLRSVEAAVPPGAWRAMSIVLTFHVVCTGWVLFRAGSLDTVLDLLSRMYTLHQGSETLADGWAAAWLAGVVLLYGGAVLLRRWTGYRAGAALAGTPAWAAKGLLYVALVLACLLLSPQTSRPFIYFQF